MNYLIFTKYHIIPFHIIYIYLYIISYFIYINIYHIISCHIISYHIIYIYRLFMSDESPCFLRSRSAFRIRQVTVPPGAAGEAMARLKEGVIPVEQKWFSRPYPLVNIQINMENHFLKEPNRLFLWAMFKSYVKLPEGLGINLGTDLIPCHEYRTLDGNLGFLNHGGPKLSWKSRFMLRGEK